MQIQNVQLNSQLTFGTKEKMNPNFIHSVCSSGEQPLLKKGINILENL